MAVFRLCLIFVFLVLWSTPSDAGDQISLSYANCQLTNTCFEKTTDDLAKERPTTLKTTEKETTSNTQTTFTTSKNTIAANKQVSIHTTDESPTEATSSSYISLDFIITSYTTTPLSNDKQLTTVSKRKSQVTNEVAEESTVAMTTVDALKSTYYESKSSEAYTVSSVSKFDTISCNYMCMTNVIDFIYILCYGRHPSPLTIRTYDVSIPHDLLMINAVDEINLLVNITWHVSMVGIENRNTLYVVDSNCKCIWKIDTVSNKVDKWLSELGEEFSLSVANYNYLLVLRLLEDLLYLQIYDQDAQLVRSDSLPNDFKHPLRAIQKPNGEFIVSHISKESNEMCVSFLSADGQIISQFRLRETVGFKNAQLFIIGNYSELVAAERFSGNVYTADWKTKNWNLTELSVIISNISDESCRKVVGFRSTDGQIIQIDDCADYQFVRLFWDADYNSLFVAENIFWSLYQLNTESLKWSEIGRIMHYDLYYDTKKKQFICLFIGNVDILVLNY